MTLSNFLKFYVCIYKRCSISEKAMEMQISEVLNLIQNGGKIFDDGKTLKELTEEGRNLKNNPEEYKKLKVHKIPAIAVHAIFPNERGRDKEHHFNEVQILMFDIDHRDDADDIIATIKENPVTYNFIGAAFKSLSGKGIHLFIPIKNLNDENFKACYQYISDIIQYELKVELDPACNDIARLMILNYDPDIYINQDAKVFDALSIMEELKKFELIEDPDFDQNITQEGQSRIQKYLDKANIVMHTGTRHNTTVKLACALNRAGFDKQEVMNELVSRYAETDFTEAEITSIVKDVYTRYATEHGINQKKQEKKSSKAQKSTTPNSQEETQLEELEEVVEYPDLENDIPLLPAIFQHIAKYYHSKQERFVKVWSNIFALTAILRCKVQIRQKLCPLNLGLCICGAPASGKSIMLDAIQHFEIHHKLVLRDSKKEVEKYQAELEEWNECKEERKQASKKERLLKQKVRETMNSEDKGQQHIKKLIDNYPEPTTEAPKDSEAEEFQPDKEPCDCGPEPIQVKPKYVLHQATGSYIGMTEAMQNASPHSFLIYTSELDDLNNTSPKDFSNLSVLIRKVMSGESMIFTYKDRRIELENPQGCVLFSGTKNQFIQYFKSSDNGEFSRFQHLFLNSEKYRPLADDYEPLADDYDKNNNYKENERLIEGEILSISNYFTRYSFDIYFTKEQLEKIDKAMAPFLQEANQIVDDDYRGSLMRFVQQVCIIAASLSAFFACEKDWTPEGLSPVYTVDDKALQFVLNYVPFFVEQNKAALNRLPILPTKGNPRNLSKYQKLYNALPFQFAFDEGYQKAETTLKISESTFKRLLKRWENANPPLLEKIKHGAYQKTNHNNSTK